MMIKKETKKAYQLETEDGKLFWIQKRWMREDGTLTAAGEKAKAQAKAPVQGIKLATGRSEIPAEIVELFKIEPSVILFSDYAQRSGKWNVIEFGSMGGAMHVESFKIDIAEITGKAAFVKTDCSGRQGRAGWLAE